MKLIMYLHFLFTCTLHLHLYLHLHYIDITLTLPHVTRMPWCTFEWWSIARRQPRAAILIARAASPSEGEKPGRSMDGRRRLWPITKLAKAHLADN